ncbi:hypothetical protein [Oceanobacter antarcticus]|uniref:Uncharacterized protein n=1 Tax=Oceanobacter antarcticus TaxID=3133425 RepID=A0ABW8NKJ8_9GAMM
MPVECRYKTVLAGIGPIDLREKQMERIERDFFAREKDDQDAFLSQTWCNECMEADLGMVEPQEYEMDGVVVVEGKCAKCGSAILTEIADDDTDGEWEDDQ